MSAGDFHCHSNRSDGTRSPTALVDLAAANGVRVLALTDHDTLDGLDEAQEAAARHPGMRLVPGVEFGCYEPGTEVHILGLFVDPSNAAFRAEIEDAQRMRIERGETITAALASLGAPVSWERVREIAGEASIGRPHFARALIEAGHVADVDEAFERYLGRNSPAYVEGKRLLPREAVDLIHGAGGLAVFAHPPFTEDYERIAEDLAAPDLAAPDLAAPALAAPGLAGTGLDGIEVYYRHYDGEQVASLRALADRLGLLPSGGSDYHGLPRAHEHEPGDFEMPDEAIEALLEAARDRGSLVPSAAGPEAGR